MRVLHDQEQISSGRLVTGGYTLEWTVVAPTGHRVPR
jgi:hypothetical protein